MKSEGGFMSDIVQYAVWVVRQFLANQIDLGVFAQNLGGIYVYARERPDNQMANSLVSALMSPYAQFSSGFVSEEYLRSELEKSIRPFAPQPIELVGVDGVHDGRR